VGTLEVGIAQGNVEQDHKWDPAYQDDTLARYRSLTTDAVARGARLVVWPETATPFFFQEHGPLRDAVLELAEANHVHLVFGSPAFRQDAAGALEELNRAYLVSPDGREVATYDKMQLVPFGEYVPLKRALFFVGPLVEAVSDFSPGAEPSVFDVGGGHRVSVAICYESVYPWIDRAFVQRGSQLLATITNDAWFGRSSAAYQHFDQGAVRAVEEGRYVVRAANTGISGAVDPYGRVLASTSLFEPAAIAVDVRLLDGRTFYSRFGDLIVWLSLLVSSGIAIAPWRRAAGGR
jgi:apolipoprotein N-acyltransferase